MKKNLQGTQLDLPIIVPQAILTIEDPTWSFVREQVKSDTAPEHHQDSVNLPVREQVKSDTAPEHITHWVEKYWVKRGAKKHYYWRYVWMSGRKMHRQHLGNNLEKLNQVKEAIADGKAPGEIKQIILTSK